MSIAKCSITDCTYDHSAKGFFGQHYKISNKENRVEYGAWKNMNRRCYNKKTPYYEHYGGRGITVCGRWRSKNGYSNFLKDMGKRPSKKHSLDRINNDGNYEPANCRWADHSTQQSNKRLQRNNTSGYRGVYFRKDINKWSAALYCRGQRIFVGHFNNANAAANAIELMRAKSTNSP